MYQLRTLILAATCLAGIYSQLSADDDDKLHFDRACHASLDRLKSITYRVDAEVLGAAENSEMPAVSAIQIDALMGCDKRRFRFEMHHKAVNNVHLLDRRGFHACESNSKAAWEVKSAKTITAESDWIMLYPLLLAHGIVPLPPFDLPALPVAGSTRRSAYAPDFKNRRLLFSFDRDRPLRVSISHNRKALIENYQVTSHGEEVLEITNVYRPQGRVVRLDRFSATVFGSDGKPSKFKGGSSSVSSTSRRPSMRSRSPEAPTSYVAS